MLLQRGGKQDDAAPDSATDVPVWDVACLLNDVAPWVGLFCSDILSNRVPPSFIPQWAQMDAVDGQAAVDRRLIGWADSINDLDELASFWLHRAEHPQLSI
jgi:hypothetical protein